MNGVNCMAAEETEWLSVLEVEKATSIPDATIRRYIRNHGHHLNVKKKGKSYIVSNKSLPIILKIREFYGDGKGTEQVEEMLVNMGVPTVITMTDDVTVNTGEVLRDMEKAMNAIHEKLEKQEAFNEQLLEALKKQQEYIDTRLEERDKNLMIALKESLETKKLIAASQEKSWWQKLFKK